MKNKIKAKINFDQIPLKEMNRLMNSTKDTQTLHPNLAVLISSITSIQHVPRQYVRKKVPGLVQVLGSKNSCSNARKSGYLPFTRENRKFQLEDQMVRAIPFGELQKIWALICGDANFLLF